jgi:pimeloyl-ACP methyl ester carboxylesterase
VFTNSPVPRIVTAEGTFLSKYHAITHYSTGGNIMKYVWLVLNWLFSIIFSLVVLSMALNGNWLQALAILVIVLLILPPVRKLTHNITGKSLPWWGRTLSIVVLLAVFVLLGNINPLQSIFKSPEIEAKLMAIYDAHMEQWPVPYESTVVETSYGDVYVIISGPKDAPPALLFHAGALPSWSWRYNIEALSQRYRTYAIDAIGEAGKSVLRHLDYHPKNGKEIAELYVEIADTLGVDQAYVVGASYGGFIGTNYALYAPERVKKLALLGPMGVTPNTGDTLLTMTVCMMFPMELTRDYLVRWAFGDNAQVVEFAEEWFRAVLVGVVPCEALPETFTSQQLQSIHVPVLLVLGEKDTLAGEPEKITQSALNIPEITIEVLNTGHGIWVEQPDKVNAFILEFFAEDE